MGPFVKSNGRVCISTYNVPQHLTAIEHPHVDHQTSFLTAVPNHSIRSSKLTKCRSRLEPLESERPPHHLGSPCSKAGVSTTFLSPNGSSLSSSDSRCWGPGRGRCGGGGAEGLLWAGGLGGAPGLVLRLARSGGWLVVDVSPTADSLPFPAITEIENRAGQHL